MRVVLAMGLFAIGVELPKSYMAKHVRGLLVLVVPTMAIGWVIVAGAYVGVMYGHYSTLCRHLEGALRRVKFCLVSGHRCLSDSDRPYHMRRDCW